MSTRLEQLRSSSKEVNKTSASMETNAAVIHCEILIKTHASLSTDEVNTEHQEVWCDSVPRFLEVQETQIFAWNSRVLMGRNKVIFLLYPYDSDQQLHILNLTKLYSFQLFWFWFWKNSILKWCDVQRFCRHWNRIGQLVLILTCGQFSYNFVGEFCFVLVGFQRKRPRRGWDLVIEMTYVLIWTA